MYMHIGVYAREYACDRCYMFHVVCGCVYDTSLWGVDVCIRMWYVCTHSMCVAVVQGYTAEPWAHLIPLSYAVCET